jgi:hypothetical protein
MEGERAKTEYAAIKSYALSASSEEEDAESPYLRNAALKEKPGKEILPGKIEIPNVTKYSQKIEFKGNIIEFLECEKSVKCGGRKDKKENTIPGSACEFPEISHLFVRIYGKPRKIESKLSKEERKEAEERSKKESARRKYKRCSDICNINFSTAESFASLTFAEDVSPQDAWKEFSLFRRRLSYQYPDCTFFNVLELQQSGRPHFHCLLNGLPGEVFKKKWYIKSKKRSKPFFVLKEDGSMVSDIFKAKFFASKKEAKKEAKKYGLDVAYTSPLVSVWRQGFVEIHDLRDRHGELVSDVFAYLAKYMTKEEYLPKGTRGYSFSRGKLRLRPFRLFEVPAKKLFEWIQDSCSEFIRYMNCYDGENPYLGVWRKFYLTLERDFMADLLDGIEEIFGIAREMWGEGGILIREISPSSWHFTDLFFRVGEGLA